MADGTGDHRYRFTPTEADFWLSRHIEGYCRRLGVSPCRVVLFVHPSDLTHLRRFPSYQPAPECDGFLCGQPIFADARVTPTRVQLEVLPAAAHWDGRMSQG